MWKLFDRLVPILLAVVVAACSEDDNSSITFSSGSVVELYPVASQSKQLSFKTADDWTASCQADWLNFSPRKGSAGSNTITLTAASTNRTKSTRSASLVLTSGTDRRTVTVVQSAKYAIFDQKEYIVGAEGGALSLTFKTNIEDDTNLQIMYTKQDWILWGDDSRSVTRAELSGSTKPLSVLPNPGSSTRVALFVLALPTDDGGWMGLDTAYVSQTGLVSDYESSDFSEDGTVTILQKASIGHGIPIVLMGDGFADKDIADGTYAQTMEKAMENIFSEEPVRSLRDYFDVYAVTAVSTNDAVGNGFQTALSTVPSNTTSVIDYDDSKVEEYVGKVENINVEDALAVVIVNSSGHNGVTALLFTEQGRPRQHAVSLCSLMGGLDDEEFRLVLVHEAVGHGLAKLADEYGYEANGAPTDKEAKLLQQYHKFNWMLNADVTDDVAEVLWSPFIGDSRFSNEHIGIYEGAFTYALGVYRPTEESMMRSNLSPFNAPCRKVIYDKVMELAIGADTSPFAEFAAFDEQHKPEKWNYSITRGFTPLWRSYLAPPIVKKGRK